MTKQLALAVFCLVSATTAADSEGDQAFRRYQKDKQACSRYPAHAFADAAWKGDVKTVRRFLDEEVPASLSIPDENNEGTPPSRQAIHLAASGGHLEIIKLLLSRGAAVNAKTSEEATPLHWANDVETARLLLAHGANPTAKDLDGEQPVHAAARDDNSKTVQLLMKHGASVTARADGGETPLHEAAFRGSPETVRLLLSRDVPVSPVIRHHEEYFRNGWQPLHFAAARGDSGGMEISTLLLSRGADANALTDDGTTPLHEANGAKTIELLILSGAKVRAVDRSGNHPLHLAALHGDTGKIAALLAHGADVSALDGDGETALDVATFFRQKEAVELLLKSGTKTSSTTIQNAKRAGDRNLIRKVRLAAHKERPTMGPIHRR